MQAIEYRSHVLKLDKDFCRLMDEISAFPEAYVIKPRTRTIINADGGSYLGYTTHTAVLHYRGLIYSIHPSRSYPNKDPFTHSKWYFVPSVRIGLTDAHACNFAHKYVSFDDIVRFSKRLGKRRMLKDTQDYHFVESITPMTENFIRDIVRSQGDSRERKLMKDRPLLIPDGVWDADHRIVRVLSTKLEEYGQRAYFDVDLANWQIVKQ